MAEAGSSHSSHHRTLRNHWQGSERSGLFQVLGIALLCGALLFALGITFGVIAG